jgi:hypothetical protein
VQQLSATLSAMEGELGQAEKARAMEVRLMAREAEIAAKHAARPKKAAAQSPSVKCKN